MNKAQKIIVGFFVISILVIASLWIVYNNKQKNQETTDYSLCNPAAYPVLNETNMTLPKDITFYYGITCPHCKKVEAWMTENPIDKKLTVTQKEVYNNPINAGELMLLGTYCNLSSYRGAVPLLYINKTCYIGDVDIICVLHNVAGAN